MTRLKQRDIVAFSGALKTLHADTRAATLSKRVLATLRALFDCDFASFAFMDLRQARFHATALAPLVPDWPGTEVHQRHLRSDPAAAYIMRTRNPQALKISDFVSLREYRSLSVYTEVFGRVGCDRRMGFAVKDRSPVSLVATLNRRRRDFTEEDRRLLDLLRPHLQQANAQAEADSRIRAEQVQPGAAGLGELDAAGRLRWLTPRGETLLAAFFPGRRPAKTLPPELAKRIASTLRSPLAVSPPDPPRPRRQVWRFAGPDARKLQVRLVPRPRADGWYLLLEEITVAASARRLAPALKLTPREGEILYWLKHGQTNREIGLTLGVSEKTAGKHLENIFSKLGVETRTAAVRVAAEVAN